ncbi:helix-turn-helix domain-containing protein [Planctomycetota bacterium]
MSTSESPAADDFTLTRPQTAEALGVCAKTLQRYDQGGCPSHKRKCPDGQRRVFCSLEAVERWMCERGLSGQRGRPLHSWNGHGYREPPEEDQDDGEESRESLEASILTQAATILDLRLGLGRLPGRLSELLADVADRELVHRLVAAEVEPLGPLDPKVWG